MMRSSVVLVALAALSCAGCGLTTTTEASSGSTPLPTLSSIVERAAVPGTDAPTGGARQPVGVERIVMIGDSITVASEAALTDYFTAIEFPEALIVSQEGKRMASDTRSNPSGASVAEFLTAEPADRSDELWIVALGTNDINQYQPEDLETAMDEMLIAVPPEAPLIWVDTYFRGEPEGTALVNEMIERRVAARGNAAVARWSEVADTEGALRTDGVHPRDAGSELFAATVAAAVTDFLDT